MPCNVMRVREDILYLEVFSSGRGAEVSRRRPHRYYMLPQVIYTLFRA